MTAVELLREAARVMRECANVANPSPWARPDMARAVADLLERDADHLAEHIPAWTAPSRGVDDPPGLCWNNPDRLDEVVERHYGRALAVARIYLGVTP